MDAKKDLDSQQQHLTAVKYDLRITNLARFIGEKLKKQDVTPAKEGISGSSINHSAPLEDNLELKLLDVGAGSGLMLKYFKDLGYSVAGIELDPSLVSKMKKDPDLKGLSIQQGDITKLKGKEEFDVVVCNDVIEHIEDDRRAIKNLWTYVKPGGMLVITVPAHSFLYSQRDVDWGHFRRYNRDELVQKMTETTGTVKFITFWNVIGFFVYFLMEILLKLKTHEEIRYNESKRNTIIKKGVDAILQLEKNIGGLPIGLSLVVGMKKEKIEPF
jgi:2-polyprenyl-3-methyl-5-hydroxy-6-metoxy-1,4-benzoquinol methylase